MTIEMQPSTLDAASIAVSNKMTLGGAAGTIAGWATSSAFGVWAGIVIGLAGLALNFYFKRRSDAREHALYLAKMRKYAVTGSDAPLEADE